MKLQFTEEQSDEMYAVLIEIHSALQDKATNINNKLTIYEKGWLQGIDELLKKIKKHEGSFQHCPTTNNYY